MLWNSERLINDQKLMNHVNVHNIFTVGVSEFLYLVHYVLWSCDFFTRNKRIRKYGSISKVLYRKKINNIEH